MNMPKEFGGEDNSRYWDNAPVYCINAGKECPLGTLVHEDSEGQCCARCESDGYREEAWRTVIAMHAAVTSSGDEFDKLKDLHEHELRMAYRWMEIARKGRMN